MLDVGTTVTADYQSLKEVALFLVSPAANPDPAVALGLYISVGGQEWQYRGYVGNSHPSEAWLNSGQDGDGSWVYHSIILKVHKCRLGFQTW